MILIDTLGPGGRDPGFPLSRSELTGLCQRLLAALGLEGREFELTLTRDGDMARINADFAGVAAPTNVLSFPAAEALDHDGPAPLDPADVHPGCPLPGLFLPADLDGAPEDGCCVDEEDFRPDDDLDAGDGEMDGEPGDGPRADPNFLGSMVLSVDTLAREAFLYGQDPAAHLARLLAHSLLHLAGVAHGEEMEERTEAALVQVFFPEA